MDNNTFLKSFSEFLRRRENELSKTPDMTIIQNVYEDLVKPALTLLQLNTEEWSDEKRTIFSGEIFALASYLRFNFLSVSKCVYEPTIDFINGTSLQPDFIVNDEIIIEVYSPRFPLTNSSSELLHEGIDKFVPDKIEKYSQSDKKLILIVQLVSAGFPNDAIMSLRRLDTPENCEVHLLHGSKMIDAISGSEIIPPSLAK